jgi:hypothetical protein
MKNYIDTVHKQGFRFVLISSLLMLMVPLAFSLVHQAWPSFELILVGFLSVGVIYIPIGIIETFTYAPMMGVAATYIANVTGNISNLKLPVTLAAIKQAKLENGSDEAEIISTIAVASSSIVTTLIIALGVLLMLPYLDTIKEVLGPVTDYLVPAIFGAIGFVFIVRYYKLTIVPMFVMLILFSFVIKDATVQPALVPIASLISIFAARYMFKKGWVKA